MIKTAKSAEVRYLLTEEFMSKYSEYMQGNTSASGGGGRNITKSFLPQYHFIMKIIIESLGESFYLIVCSNPLLQDKEKGLSLLEQYCLKGVPVDLTRPIPKALPLGNDSTFMSKPSRYCSGMTGPS